MKNYKDVEKYANIFKICRIYKICKENVRYENICKYIKRFIPLLPRGPKGEPKDKGPKGGPLALEHGPLCGHGPNILYVGTYYS